ncbi:hypothetical protein BG004_000985 [Podila humilis]|nr:hypothetical protein BG004_000985 [Podila humilis]
MQIGQIFESIQNLKSLELWLWCVGSGSVFLSVCRQILEQQSALELRHLYLSMEDRVLENAVLARILPRCPKLESLMLFDPGMTKMYNEQAFTLEPLAPLFRNHCPGLKKLSINVAEEDTLQLVNSCTGLESLLLTIPFGPDPETLLDVMCSCSNLRTLNIHIVQESRPSDATETHGKSLKRRMQHAWMCVDLEDLTLEYSLGYGRTLSSDDSFRDRKMEVGGGSLLDRYFEYVFTQIGRLTRMKHLEIVVGYKLMVLKQGHLTKLAGLRNMQSVYLTHAQQAEAQWVMENWPMVVEVAGFPLEEDRGRIASLARWKPDFVIR